MSSVGVSENVGSSIVLVRVLVIDLGLRRLPVEESRARARLRIEERRIGMGSTASWATKSGSKPGD